MWACLIQSYLLIASFNHISGHPLFSPHILVAGGVFGCNNQKTNTNESVNEGDEWSMEVDLRSREKEKRTLHWFVNGKQQKVFIKGVPARVEFAVSYFIYSTYSISPYLYHLFRYAHLLTRRVLNLSVSEN